MIRQEEVYKIGVLNKPHGIHGELLFTFTDDVFDRVDADYLICRLDGIFVPFFFESYRFRSDTTALVKFEGIDSIEEAQPFTNIEVYFPTALSDEAPDGELSWNYFVGFRVEDAMHDFLGTIVEVDTTTINTLFVLERRDGSELLIPAQEAFIAAVDKKLRSMTVDLPEGLLTIDQLTDEEEEEE
ncbi:MAG: ribosome maturation factor RimM [Prevotellaceae bacterium]|jgi:16S rRNA processing protein RimM|nr:ribosome maturation factor RimM [Prevotellaceae bacterium]